MPACPLSQCLGVISGTAANEAAASRISIEWDVASVGSACADRPDREARYVSKVQVTNSYRAMKRYSVANRRTALLCVPKLYRWDTTLTSTSSFTSARSDRMVSASGTALEE